jgi:glycosyltransferase involved in cell wall biosynthesis
MSESPSSGEPLVSVVIASVNGRPYIEECLDALLRQTGDVAYEVLVVDCCDDDTRDAIRGFPDPVRLIEVDGRPSIPKLRAVGVQQARGRMIAILEDHCIVCTGWIEVIAGAYERGVRALGGAVENGSPRRIVDWAVFFCEYARFMLPVPIGEVDAITGNNSAYAREVFESLGPQLEKEEWEWFWHAAMRAHGVTFHCDPALLVSHKKEFGFGYFLAQRYHHSRSFTAMRMEAASPLRRLAYAAMTPLLPPLLMVRIARTVWPKHRKRREFVLAIPFIAIFLLSGAWGEAMGALVGPGNSLERVE